MYLNPSAADEETRMDELIAQLLTIGVPRYSHEALLGASTLSELILRAARNIYHSVYENHAVVHARHGNGIHRAIDLARAFPDLEGSFYSALWALLLLGVPPDGDGPAVALRRRNYLPHIVEQFETNFPYDIDLIENYIVPLFQNTVEHVQLRESIRVVRSVDSMPKQVKTRRRAITQQVKYKVGQVFVHKRYDYQAVITGWDVECAAHENWIAQMRVHELSQGRQQSFYHVL
jgi:F-box protein 21